MQPVSFRRLLHGGSRCRTDESSQNKKPTRLRWKEAGPSIAWRRTMPPAHCLGPSGPFRDWRFHPRTTNRNRGQTGSLTKQSTGATGTAFGMFHPKAVPSTKMNSCTAPAQICEPVGKAANPPGTCSDESLLGSSAERLPLPQCWTTLG